MRAGEKVALKLNANGIQHTALSGILDLQLKLDASTIKKQ